MNLDKLLAEVEELEERFLGQEEKTGNPALDQEPVEADMPEDEFDEVAMMMEVTQSSVSNAMMSIEMMMRRGHKDKLIAMFGEEAAQILQETLECLEGVVELFDLAAKMPGAEGPMPEVQTPEEPTAEEPAAEEPAPEEA
jgi:hypothetical protein